MAQRPDDLSPFSRGRRAPGEPPCRHRPRPAAPGCRGRRHRRPADRRRASPSGCGRRCTHGPERAARSSAPMRDLGLVTVCEEAGCPNLSECWADGTATFMINGERCTRACGFCLVDTRHPRRARPGRAASGSPRRSPRMGLAHAVLTTVARDDLADGGAERVRRDDRGDPRAARPACAVEVLIPDCKGDPSVARRDLRRPARRAEPQPRDGRPAAAGGAPVGRLRPQPGRAGPGQGGRAHHEVGAHRRHGRDRRRGRRHARRPAPASASTSSPSASTCGRRPTTCRSPAGWPPAAFERLQAEPARRSASATSRPSR